MRSLLLKGSRTISDVRASLNHAGGRVFQMAQHHSLNTRVHRVSLKTGLARPGHINFVIGSEEDSKLKLLHLL